MCKITSQISETLSEQKKNVILRDKLLIFREAPRINGETPRKIRTSRSAREKGGGKRNNPLDGARVSAIKST